MALNQPVLSGPGAGRTVTHGAGTSTELKLAGEQSGGDWAVVEWLVRAGDEQADLHTPTREDETLYVLAGAITAYVGDETFEVEAGSYAALPKDVPHGLTVRGAEAGSWSRLSRRARSTSSCRATTPTTTRRSSSLTSTMPAR